MLKRILITGGTGLLGKSLIETQPSSVEVHATHFRTETAELLSCPSTRLNITNKNQVERLVSEFEPSVVIHAAWADNVDFAQNNRESAREVNVGGVQCIVEVCKRSGAKLVFLSTNAVFDGDTPPYDEDSLRHPINYYGELKKEAEDVIMASGIEFAIVRPIMMYGWNHPQGRKNPVTVWIESLLDNKPIKVVNDRFWQPLLVDDCAAVVWSILENNASGIYHVASPNRLSLFEFALQTAEVFELDKAGIESVPSSYFPSIAPRPVDTSLRIDKIQNELGIHPRDTLAGLQRMKATQVKF